MGSQSDAEDRLREKYPTVQHTPSLQPTPADWLVEKVWLRNAINYVCGAEKAGKSRWMQWMLTSLLTDGDNELELAVAAKEDQPKRWLYIAAEEQPGEVAERIRGYARLMGTKADVLPIWFHPASMLQLERYDVRQEIERLMVAEDYEGVVIDPLRRVHLADENDNTAMASLNNTFRRWTNELGRTLVIVHHTGHTHIGFDPGRIANWMRGATDLATALDVASFLWRPDVSERKVQLYRGGRFAPTQPVDLYDGSDPPKGIGWRLWDEYK